MESSKPSSPKDLLVAAKGHVLVMGGPGSGKTTIALDKALSGVERGLLPGQSILFLSFSRAAVARLGQAAQHSGGSAMAAVKSGQLSLQTFHSFFWQIIKANGYLLGAPRELDVLMPHDEKAHSGSAKPGSPEWDAWLSQRRDMFHTKGLVAFDLFAPLTVELIKRSSLIKSQIALQYPIIVVDEAQDTGPDAWSFLVEMKDRCQIICLADLDQQIFDHLPGIGPERVEAIRKELQPLELDLGQANNRSPGTEIHVFAADILAGTARGAPYTGVSTFTYNPKTANPAQYLRAAMAVAYREMRKRRVGRGENCAILAPTGREVANISDALTNAPRPVPHKIVFDEAQALLAARFAAFLLEPKGSDGELGEGLIMLAAMQRASGTKDGRNTSDKLRSWAAAIAAGKTLNWPRLKAIRATLEEAKKLQFTGSPAKDWLSVKSILLRSSDPDLNKIAGHLDYLVAFRRGRAITDQLSTIWKSRGDYAGARRALDIALAQDAILGGSDDLSGVHVMTIHRSKGKQFDTVILLRRGVPIGPGKWRSSFVWRDDEPPYQRSRKILRVGITRARKQVIILSPIFPNCPLLNHHCLS